MTNVVAAIAIALLPRFMRLARGLTIVVRRREFAEAAYALGASDGRIMLRHILPQIRGQTVVYATLWTATAIRVEASLSFLGLGVNPPTPTWGNMIRDSRSRFHFFGNSTP